MNTVLITGATSGLGRSLLAHYHGLGWRVIAVNRRPALDLVERYPGTVARELDISNSVEVGRLLDELELRQEVPDYIVLNAGINLADNQGRFNLAAYREVLRVNLDGVMTFVAALQQRGWSDKTIATISSTSTVVPNPAHLGYFLSKLALLTMVPILQKTDPANRYKTVVLGPAVTNLMAQAPPAEGLQGKLFDLLAVDADKAARACARFFATKRAVLRYPLSSYLFYLAIRLLLAVFPGLYKVKKAEPASQRGPHVGVG